MKKLFLLGILPIFLSFLYSCDRVYKLPKEQQCTPLQKNNESVTVKYSNFYGSHREEFLIVTLDSCEFLVSTPTANSTDYPQYIHRPRCKFCAKRSKK